MSSKFFVCDPPVGDDAAGGGDVNVPDPEEAGAGIGALYVDEGVPTDAGLAQNRLKTIRSKVFIHSCPKAS